MKLYICDSCGQLNLNVWMPIEDFIHITGVSRHSISVNVYTKSWGVDEIVIKDPNYKKGKGRWFMGNPAKYFEWKLKNKTNKI